jgi:hypothetical protein
VRGFSISQVEQMSRIRTFSAVPNFQHIQSSAFLFKTSKYVIWFVILTLEWSRQSPLAFLNWSLLSVFSHVIGSAPRKTEQTKVFLLLGGSCNTSLVLPGSKDSLRAIKSTPKKTLIREERVCCSTRASPLLEQG